MSSIPIALASIFGFVSCILLELPPARPGELLST
jgi:hypothetical protein